MISQNAFWGRNAVASEEKPLTHANPEFLANQVNFMQALAMGKAWLSDKTDLQQLSQLTKVRQPLASIASPATIKLIT
jgi:hypothetical protein